MRDGFVCARCHAEGEGQEDFPCMRCKADVCVRCSRTLEKCPACGAAWRKDEAWTGVLTVGLLGFALFLSFRTGDPMDLGQVRPAEGIAVTALRISASVSKVLHAVADDQWEAAWRVAVRLENVGGVPRTLTGIRAEFVTEEGEGMLADPEDSGETVLPLGAVELLYTTGGRTRELFADGQAVRFRIAFQLPDGESWSPYAASLPPLGEIPLFSDFSHPLEARVIPLALVVDPLPRGGK